MLSKIFIKNYILIDELELDLAEGLNIITGETGAGKSILINAIDIAFGAKAGKEVIKTGADKAVIELTILNKKQDLSELFEEYGWDWTDHACREWSGWSVEHAGKSRKDNRRVGDTDRKQVLLMAFEKNQK